MLREVNPRINADPAYPQELLTLALDIMDALRKSAGVQSEKDNMRVAGRKYMVWLKKDGSGQLWKFDRAEEATPAPIKTLTIDRVHIDGQLIEFWFKERNQFLDKTGSHLSAKLEAVHWAIDDADLQDVVYTSGLQGQILKWQLLNGNYEILGFAKSTPSELDSEQVQAFLASLGEPGTAEYDQNVETFLTHLHKEVTTKQPEQGEA